MELAVSAAQLVKRFGSVTAVAGISFQVEQGEIFGILGPNGAGKTTTLEIIEGLQKPTGGSVAVLGEDIVKRPQRVKARLGVQLQAASYFDYLTLRETLALLGSCYPQRRAPGELLELAGLSDKAHTRLRQLSGGQKQRFSLAASLVNNPELLILDEPSAGLDPQARRNLWGLIRQINGQGVTILLTTHYMEEAQTLCRRVAIMDGGKIVAVDTPAGLIARLQAAYTVKLELTAPAPENLFAQLNGAVASAQALGGASYLLRLKADAAALDAVLRQLAQRDLKLSRLEITPVTLEDVFLELTGSALRD